jgi:hypothetical protein
MSPSPATVKTLAERRVRRQKIFIAVGSVALLGILGFELPKVLGGKNGNQAAITTSSAASAPGAAAAPVVPAGQLPSDRVVVVRDSTQLISFGLFKSKDPFVQQLTTSASTTPATPPPAPPPPAGTTPTTSPEAAPPVLLVPLGTPGSTNPSSPSSPSTVPGTTTPSTPAPPPVPTEALIATNGVCERVAVKGTFPATENIFRLVSVAKDGKSVQVGIVGGSFDSGQPTATLKQGDKLTLVNTADGTRYVIELKAQCAGLDTQSVGTQTTTTSQPVPTTPVAPAPAPAPAPATTSTTTTTGTVTTPIVTDADDTTPPSS